jgi:hypothetical protein
LFIANSIQPPLDNEHTREKQRKAVEKWFKREAADALEVDSKIEQVGERAGSSFLRAFAEQAFGGALPTAQVVQVTAKLARFPIEMNVSIGYGRSHWDITTIDWLARLPKALPEQANANALASSALKKAMRRSYKSLSWRITVEPRFAIKPAPDGSVIWLRSCPKTVWWSFGFLNTLGVMEFVNLVDEINGSS